MAEPTYTQGDLAAIREAIALGARKVRFADNRETEFRSLDDMLRIEARIVAAVSGKPRPTRVVAGYRSGLSW